jgi:dihydroflavonol-4-reductase
MKDETNAAPILVTGGTGFLGRHLVERLLEAGERVRVLARAPDADLEGAGAEIHPGSLLNREALDRALAGVERVYHCAGLVSRDRTHARKLYEIHVDGSRALLEAAKAAGVKRVVVASTSGTVAVSRDPEPIPDETSPDPLPIIGDWPYYTSKLYQERAVLRLGAELGIEVVCVNPSLLLGPGDRRLSSSGDVLRFVSREVPVVPPGGLSFVDARDAAEGAIAAMAKGRAGERYLLGGANMSFEKFFGMLSRISGVSAPRLKLPPKAARLGARVLDFASRTFKIESAVDPVSVEMSEVYWYLDDTKAREELGWSPRDGVETLSDTLADLKSRGLWEAA